MEERVPNGTKVKELETNTIYTIVDAIETDNKWLQGVYLYRFEGKLDTGFGLYRHEFEIVKDTKVISGFPGIGKSHLFENRIDLTILDSDSSQFSWIEKWVRHPDFPQNYIEHIKVNIGKVDVILVSSHKVVRDALSDNRIEFTLVYPSKYCKDEYLNRYRERGSDEKFVNMMDENWDKFYDECEDQECDTKIRLKNEQFLVDVIGAC